MQSNPQISQVKIKCEYCGNNPVPHFVYWFFESLNILLSPIRQSFLKAFSFIRLPDASRIATKIGNFFGIISFNLDINKCKVERAKVLWEEAQKRGIKMEELLLFGKPFDVYAAEANQQVSKSASKQISKVIIFSGLPRPRNIDRVALDAMDDKAILKKKFVEAGLPVPKGGSVWNFGQAKKIFKDLECSVPIYGRPGWLINPPRLAPSETGRHATAIVKPRAGSRGRHSTTFVSTVDDLESAYKIAKQLCFWVVVEEQLFGPVYRATVINYELCGVLRGDSPQVVGDGLNSIMKLIEIKNLSPHPGIKDIKTDHDTEKFLARQNLKLTSVLTKGQIVSLSEKIGVSYGGSSSEDFEICHPDNKELFVKAAKVVSDPIIGFDFIIPDITKSYKEQKCGFLEANSLPFINLHHNPLLGKSRNVAAKVWDTILNDKNKKNEQK